MLPSSVSWPGRISTIARQREDGDPDPRRAEARVQPPQRVGHLAVDAHRVDEPRDADDAGVGGQEQDRRGEQADVDLGHALEDPEVHLLDHAEHRVAGEAALLLGAGRAASGTRRRRCCAPAAPRARRRQREVDREHGEPHAVDRRRDRVRLVLGLLGHVRDRLDPRVGEHADRDREDEVAPRRRHAELRRCRPASRARTSTAPITTSSSWVRKSTTASVTLIPVDSLRRTR